jgi:hypothetical protein
VDESGNFVDPDDNVALAGLLVSDDLPGLSPAEVKKSLDKAVPGFPWPWHARLINSASWVALVLAARGVPSDHPDPDIRWLADAVRRVNELFASRNPAEYQALLERVGSPEAGDVDLARLSMFEQILRDECPIELDSLRAHSLRAWTAVREFAKQLVRQPQIREDVVVVLLCSSETERGDAVGSPDSPLGDRRYFRLLEVLVDRSAALLARRGGSHELSLDVSQRNLIDPVLQRPTKQIPLYVTRELAPLATKWKASVRIIPRAVTPFDRHVDMRFVVVDFAANRGRRVLRQLRVPLVGVESTLSNELGLQVRTGAPSRSHLAASGMAYAMTSASIDPNVRPQTVLPAVWPRRLWACEQAWEWCRDEGQ